MLKETTYQEKFTILNFWLDDIIECVKKDLKNEHLNKDPKFKRRYFLGKDLSQIDKGTFCKAYKDDVASGNESLAEFIATRWILKNTDIYGLFEPKMRSYNDNFESLEELPEDFSLALIKESLASFGAEKTYIFSVFNSVVFSKKNYDELKALAERETTKKRVDVDAAREKLSLQDMQKRHEREISALKEKFEKKMQGFQRKYLIDTRALQKKIVELTKTSHE